MRRHSILQTCVLWSILWVAACDVPATDAPTRQPPAGRDGAGAQALPTRPAAVATPALENIVLITVDTLRWDALGFSGNSRSQTPALDRLAAAGWTFRQAHAHNVVTLPSHANILTGLYPYQNKIRDNKGFRLSESIPTAATLLQDAGFRTGAFVGAFPLDSRFGLDRGFEVYDDEVPEGSHPTEMVPAERRGDEVVGLARQWWEDHQGQRRFLWLHLYDPHAPYEPAEPFLSRLAGDPYLGEVAAVDAYLRPLLEPFLSGEEAAALIVFTSDHGEALGDHGESTHGLFAYEATLKVPLVMWFPGIEAAVRDEPARHVDLLPTMLEAAGTKPPAGLPGRSLLEGPPVNEIFSYFESLTPALDRGWAPLRGMMGDGHKFISLPIPELYDLVDDPAEEQNLVATRESQAADLERRLPDESVWPPQQETTVDSETAAALRSLGYLGGQAPIRSEYTAADDPKTLVHLDNKMHQVIDLYQRGRLAEAEAIVQEVIEARPDMGMAYYFWAQVKLEQGRLQEAISVMMRARDAGVATPALLRQLGMSMAEVGKAKEAIPIMLPLVEGRDPEALNALGLVYSEAGDQASAQQILEQVFGVDPRNPVARQHLALVALRRSNWARARDEARLALELNEALPLAWNYLGTALYNLGSPDEALEAWDRALILEPANSDVLYNVAIVAMEAGDRVKARRALETFIDTAPPDLYGPDIQRARQLLQRLGS